MFIKYQFHLKSLKPLHNLTNSLNENQRRDWYTIQYTLITSPLPPDDNDRSKWIWNKWKWRYLGQSISEQYWRLHRVNSFLFIGYEMMSAEPQGNTNLSNSWPSDHDFPFPVPDTETKSQNENAKDGKGYFRALSSIVVIKDRQGDPVEKRDWPWRTAW